MNQVADTSRDALKRISTAARMSILERIESVVTDSGRRGVRDMSAREIRDKIEADTGRRIELSTITARVNELVTAGRLQRDPAYTRACTVTGQQIHPLRAVPKQTRAFY